MRIQRHKPNNAESFRLHPGRIVLITAAAAMLLSANTATAQTQTPAQSAATAEAVCSACHGVDGNSLLPHVPNLAGQKVGYLETQLAAFRDGTRSNKLMSPIAAQLSPAQRRGLATHFASRIPAQPVASAAGQLGLQEFPAGFPAGFSVYLDTRDGAARKVYYANDIAVRGAKAGKPLPDGSVLVVENRRVAEGGAETIGAYAVMQSGAGFGDTVPELLRNRNWRYALFDAKKVLRASPGAAECLACHKAKPDDDYTFTLTDLTKHARAR